MWKNLINLNFKTMFFKHYYFLSKKTRSQIHVLNNIQLDKLILFLKINKITKHYKFLLFLGSLNEIFKRLIYIQLKEAQYLSIIASCNNFLVEMNTGEGKTFVIINTIIWNAINNRIIHFMSSNSYLLLRDYRAVYSLYDKYNITHKIIPTNTNTSLADLKYNLNQVYYGTPQSFGFIFLKDINKVYNSNKLIYDTLVLDEMDYCFYEILPTPLIISTNIFSKLDEYIDLFFFLKGKSNINFLNNYKYLTQLYRTISTYLFYKKNKNYVPIHDIITNKWIYILSMYENSVLNLKKGIDYINTKKEIYLLDKWTGRLLKNHSYSSGIQECLEVYENITPKYKSITINKLDLLDYLYLYRKIIGFSGTLGKKSDFSKLKYNFFIFKASNSFKSMRLQHSILSIPTNFYINYIKDISFFHYQKKQPKLLYSENLHTLKSYYTFLKKNIIFDKVLFNFINAFSLHNESNLIPKLGRYNNKALSNYVTSRGTDIPFGFNNYKNYYLEITIVNLLGGLYLHFYDIPISNKIFNQLIGRTGRQKNTGEVRSLISLNNQRIRFFKNQFSKFFIWNQLDFNRNIEISIQSNKEYTHGLKKIEINNNSNNIKYNFNSIYNKLYYNELSTQYISMPIIVKYIHYSNIEYNFLKKQLTKFLFIDKSYKLFIKKLNYIYNIHIPFTTNILINSFYSYNQSLLNFLLLLSFKQHIYKNNFQYVYSIWYNTYIKLYRFLINQQNIFNLKKQTPIISLNKDISQQKYLELIILLMTLQYILKKYIISNIMIYNRIRSQYTK